MLDDRQTGSVSFGRLKIISLTLSYSNKGDTLPVQEGQRAQFYEHYRMLADSYDKKFIKRHDQDLNTTLIFVSPT